MFWEFFRFELRYWFRGSMVYIFLAILALMFFGATISDQVQVGDALSNTYRNAPFVVQTFYSIAGILTALMVTAFVDSAASRDFALKSSEIMFSRPISKWSYLLGRFCGASVAAFVPLLGVSIGNIAGSCSGFIDPTSLGPTSWAAHGYSILLFAIPNTLLFGSLIFAISVLTRSTLFAFIGTLLLIVAYSISTSFLADVENERMAAYIDPLGIGAFNVITKYWTVEEKNTQFVGLSGLVLVNRAIWLSVAVAIWVFAYSRFHFSDRTSRSRNTTGVAVERPKVTGTILLPSPQSRSRIVAAQCWSIVCSDFRAVIRSTVFLVLLACALLNMIPTVWFDSTRRFGVTTFPITYRQIESVRGSLVFFLVSIITFFAGVLVWRDRDARCHEITGGMPYRNWIGYVSKLITLLTIVALMFVSGIVLAMLAQWASGYTRFQLDVYVKELLVIDMTKMGFLAVLAIMMHSLAPNKYVGYFLFIMFVVLNAFIWNFLRVETALVKFGRMPAYIYSDLFGIEPYVPGLIGFGIYWIVFCCILGWISILIAHRGVAVPLAERWKSGWRSNSFGSTITLAWLTCFWLGLGGWLLYNTHFLNKVVGGKEQELRQANYEKQYKSLERTAQPTITDVQYEIDVFPESRNLVMRGTQTIVNKSAGPIDRVYLNLAQNYDTEVSIEGATQEANDETLLFQTHLFEPPMAAGQTRTMKYTVKTNTRGIENSVSNTQVVQNGTFFNSEIAPGIGYDSNREIARPKTRSDKGLPVSAGFPPLNRDDPSQCMHHYVGRGADWVNIETVISTSADQIAVAPGSLVEKWEKEGRNYFRYKVDHPSLNFYSFISARYEVDRSKWNDSVDVEVYYHPDHKWNVPKMVDSIHKSLDYCSSNFGPYRHKQARIIEFPRVATFAQAFPGTMPYSEGIGFIANLEDPEDIDMVYYVVAHEMAHQWWAHQVVGAKMQGATLLSETMAQYSALMIMEHKYGRDMMRKFLKYEMDTYLKQRGAEQREERPLLRVDPNQGYIHYNKGSVVLYYLKEMIGEDRINLALKSMIDKFGYHEPPYPTSLDMVDALRQHIPVELQYLVKDLFEDITVFGNRTVETSYRKLDDGKYQVELKIECLKFKSTEKGKSDEVPITDWIEIGAFAKPAKGKKYGKQLSRERIYITEKLSTHTLILDELPDQVGVDPYYLLIDRMPEDNLKRPTLLQL